MIEFNGNLSGECKKFLLKKQIKMQTIASVFTAILFSVPVTFLSIYVKPLFAICFVPLVMLVVFSMIPPSKSDQKIFMPKRVYIDLEEETIVHECEKMERFHMLSSIIRIIDYGDWYYFVFDYEDRDPYFVCQKDLITQGTLEEFENLFEGKIEKAEK